MAIAIESGIPVPSKPCARDKSKYPFNEMKVGDSFVISLDGRKSWAFIFNAISNAQKRHGIQLTTRFNDQDGTRRVWRVA